MADQITDLRTLVDSAEATTNWVPYVTGGGASVAQDTDIFIQGSASIAEQISSNRRGIAYDAGSAQDWSDNVFYIWVNCGIVGLLDTKANGGLTVRFAGPSVTDFFEFYVGGNDSWPTSVAGGWTMFVVDIEGTPSNTGGTTPATTAIQHVGITAVTSGAMTKTVDNTWVDEIRRLPDGNFGIRVEGQNGGSTPWTWADLPAELGVANGTAKAGPGDSVILNTPVDFFVDDGTDHVFEDESNPLVLWEDQEFAPTDLYGIRVLGAATGTADWTQGVKTGTGDDATGNLGGVIRAAAAGVRWFLDLNGANIDTAEMYGVTLQHAGVIDADSSAVDFASVNYVDCTTANVANSNQVRPNVVDANTADDVAFMFTDDIGDIVFGTFNFSDGQAIEITSGGPATQTSKGNLFNDYLGTAGSNLVAGPSGSTDAAIKNNAGAARTVNITDGGDTPSVRNASGSPSTTVASSVSYELTGLDEDADVTIVDITVPATPVELFNEVAGVDGVVTYTFDGALTGTAIGVYIRNTSIVNNEFDDTLPGANVSFPASQRADTVYNNPP